MRDERVGTGTRRALRTPADVAAADDVPAPALGGEAVGVAVVEVDARGLGAVELAARERARLRQRVARAGIAVGGVAAERTTGGDAERNEHDRVFHWNPRRL